MVDGPNEQKPPLKSPWYGRWFFRSLTALSLMTAVALGSIAAHQVTHTICEIRPTICATETISDRSGGHGGAKIELPFSKESPVDLRDAIEDIERVYGGREKSKETWIVHTPDPCQLEQPPYTVVRFTEADSLERTLLILASPRPLPAGTIVRCPRGGRYQIEAEKNGRQVARHVEK